MRILLAESHPLVRQAIASLLAEMPAAQLVARVGSGWEVLPTAKDLKPDLILMDLHLPGLNGLELSRLIKQELPQTGVILLLDEAEERYFKAAEQSGAYASVVRRRIQDDLPPLLHRLGKRGRKRRQKIDRPGVQPEKGG